MPMDNTLNVSELLKRLGVSGDSMGSAPLLDSMRLGITLADLSDLVPPVATPSAAASNGQNSGIGTFNQWTLRAGAGGGLRVTGLQSDSAGQTFRVWLSAADPFGNSAAVAHADLTFQNPAQSVFFANTPPEAAQFPLAHTFVLNPDLDTCIRRGNWVGPGQFFNIEATIANVFQRIAISWTEYPAFLNP